jgi:hypothetical protein
MNRRFWILITAAACLLFTSSGPFAAEATSQTAPKAEVLNDHYTFPTVVDGTKVPHTFIIRNRGDAPLVVKSVLTT